MKKLKVKPSYTYGDCVLDYFLATLLTDNKLRKKLSKYINERLPRKK